MARNNELIKVAKKAADAWRNTDAYHQAAQIIDMLVEELESDTLTQPNEWVSVYDRLPEPGERVLATDCGFVGEFYINQCGQWNRYNVNCHALLMALDILYWMPLPEPPEYRSPEGEEALKDGKDD